MHLSVYIASATGEIVPKDYRLGIVTRFPVVSSFRSVAPEVEIKFELAASTPVHIKIDVASSIFPHDRMLVCIIRFHFGVHKRPSLRRILSSCRRRILPGRSGINYFFITIGSQVLTKL